MRNVVAAFNSSVQFNKRNFWIDPVSRNQYFVGVQYPEDDIRSIETLLDVPITSPSQKKSIPLRNVPAIHGGQSRPEIPTATLQAQYDRTMVGTGRDPGHVA